MVGSRGLEPANSSAVTLWRDKSGAVRDFSQSVVASQPVYQTPVVKFGSKPSVYFNGDFLNHPVNDTLYGPLARDPRTQGLSIGTAAGVSAGTARFHPIFANVSSTISTRRCYGVAPAIVRANETAGPSASSSSTSVAIGSVSVFDGSANMTGVIQSEDLSFTSIASRTYASPNYSQLGISFSNRCGYTGNLNGHVPEVLIYNKALTSTESCDLKKYLDAKWATNTATSCGGGTSTSGGGCSTDTDCPTGKCCSGSTCINCCNCGTSPECASGTLWSGATIGYDSTFCPSMGYPGGYAYNCSGNVCYQHCTGSIFSAPSQSLNSCNSPH
jgi:hypothetical protein